MTDSAQRPKNYRLDILASVILALASLVAAWNGYEATQWSSRQGAANSQVLQARFAATRAATAGGQLQMIDILIFTNWLEATRAGDQALAAFYQARFRTEFQSAFAAWVKTEPLTNAAAPATPFVMSDYVLADMQRADQSEQDALALTKAAGEAANVSRQYIQNTLYLAAALAIAGFSRSFTGRIAYKIMLGASGLMLLIGLINTVRLPIA